MGIDEIRPSKKARFLPLLILFISVGTTLSIASGMKSVSEEAKSQVNDTQTPQARTAPAAAQGRWLFAGDIMWGRANQTAAEANGGPNYLFDSLSTFDKPEYNAWIANVECPITSTDVPLSVQIDVLKFNCKPEYLDEFSKWFDVVSLSNNHTDNIDGQAGLDETRTNLEEVGIQHFGHYDNAVLEDICEVVAMPISLTMPDGSIEDSKLPVAMCGYHAVFKLILDEEFDQLLKFSDIMPTFVLPHMGEEYTTSPDGLKTDQYRQIIDHGADAVIGGHPHWVQNTESYEGRLIAYSLGNFLFDQKWDPELKQGIALDMTLKTDYTDNLGKWIELGESCKAFKDDCLEQAKSQNLTKIDFSLDYNIVGSQYDAGQTSKADPELQAALEERTQIEKTKAELLE